MKRKRPSPKTEPAPRTEPVRQAEPAPRGAKAAQAEAVSAWDTVRVCLFTALLFLAMTVQTGRMSVLLPVLAIALSIGPGPARRLRERLCVPAAAFLAFGVASGLAAVYASFGEYAVNEFYKFMASFSVAAIVLTRFDRRHVRGLLWGIAAVCAALSLICSDAALEGGLFEAFNSMVEALGGTFRGVPQGDWGTRVNGIYNDPNISAGIMALGALCGIHLTLTGKRRWERALASLLTGINGMGFFLAVSRGAILCFGLALLAYLAAVGNGERLRLFFLILAHTVVTVLLSISATAASMAGTSGPLYLSAACGLIVWLAYEFPGFWLEKRLEGHGAALAAAAGALVLAAGVYAVMAFRITGPYTFGANGTLLREVEKEAGEYTLTAESDAVVTLAVYVLNEEGRWHQVVGHTGRATGSFSLEFPTRVQARIYGEPGETVERAVFSDGTEISLGYPLLPEFVVYRLQGNFREGSSFRGRVQYDRDGWELFKRSPLLGKGLGSTEGLLTSVQPYFYESLFLHNHVLQVMCDCGLLGAVPFLAFLLGSLWLLLRRLWERRKEGGDPLAAALLGCWVMMNAHGLMELNFSIRAYQCEAFTLLLLPVLLYGKPPAALAKKENVLRWTGIAFEAALCLYLGVFALGLELHRTVEREVNGFSTNNAEAFMAKTRRWIRMDWFDDEQHKLNFVGNAVILGDSQYEKEADRFAADLRKSGTYTACTGLAEYYYLPRGELEEMFACGREAVAQEASTDDAWNQQVEFYRFTVLPSIGAEDAAVFLEGVTALEDYLEEYSQGRQEEIELTEENRAFLDKARSALDNGMEGETALLYLAIPMEVESEE